MKRKAISHDYTITTFVFVFTSFFLFFAIRPSLNLIFTLNKERADYTTINQQLDKKIEDIIRAQNNYIALAPYIDEINQAIPNRQVLTDTREVISTGSPELVNFSVQESTLLPLAGSQLNVIGLGTTLTGTYPSIKSYLTTLRTLPRIVTLESVAITHGESTTSGSLNASVQLQTYFYHLP